MNPQDPTPSRLLLRFFRWFCRADMVEDLEGDLVERFAIRASRQGTRKAKRLFAKDILQLLRPGIIRSITGGQKLNSMDMLKSNLIVAKRQILRHKVYSGIKIGGFALGIAACLLISLFITDELRYDQHLPDKQQLYRIVKNYDEPGGTAKYTWFQAPFAQTLMDKYPEVALAGRTMESENLGAGYNNFRKANEAQNHYEDGFIYADQEIFDMFQFPMVYGNLEEALKTPFTLVMTRSKAEKFYPGQNPIGKTVILNDNTDRPYTIGGVMEDLPQHTFFDFNYICSLSNWEFWTGEQSSWQAQNYQLFVKLKPGVDPERFTASIQEINTKYVLPALEKNGNANAASFISTLSLSIQPVTDIHLHSADITDVYEKSDIQYIWIFAVIAIFILTLACVNFVNLATAKSANRAKEVGLRKAIGSVRSQLISQFLTESVLYSFLSFGLAIGITYLLIPFFNNLAGKELDVPWTSLWFVPTLIGSALLIGLFAGVYPAFYLSGFKPSSVLKGKLSMGSKRAGMRNTLVVFQFAASIILIIGSAVVYQQMNFILNTKTGFDKDQVVILKNTRALQNQADAFKTEIRQIPEVQNVTISGYLPVSGALRDGDGWWLTSRVQEDPSVSAQIWAIDEDYLPTLGMELKTGRNFDKTRDTRSNAMIINEAMARALNISDNPLGQHIKNNPNNDFSFNVIGVVNDFNFDLLTEKVQPLAMYFGTNPIMTAIKIKSQDLPSTLDAIENSWKAVAPNQPFVYEFMDQRFAMMYTSVERIRNILTAFATLAICIACMGLFGLSIFMVEQKQKEISVRLVLGARVSQIMAMLSFNFLKPIILALVIATPLAWLIMRTWLSSFVYKIEMGTSLFLLAGISTLIVALITVSFQSLKAAFSSPMTGLRNE